MFLEAIALNEKEILLLQKFGVNRIELVSEMEKDGLSPKIKTIENCLEIAQIPIRVMVRIQYENFVNSNEITKKMIEFIKITKNLPIEGFVLGGLTNENNIDEAFLDKICNVVGNKKITFHRAFDRTNNLFKSIEIIEKYPIDTILTSGGLMNKIDKNVEILDKLQKNSKNITILAGGGLSIQNIHSFYHSSISHFHVGSTIRDPQNFSGLISEEKINQFRFAYSKNK